MSSQTLYSEILNEVTKHNPHASPGEISAGIIAVMEKEIIPKVIQDLSLPKFPSWTDISIRKSRGRQRKKRFKSATSLEKRRTIIQQIGYMRRQMNWDGDSTSAPTSYFLDSDNGISPPELNMPYIREPIKHDVEKIEKTEVEDDPYGSLLMPPKAKYLINLSKEFQEKMLSDSLFGDVFRKIEVSIRELIDARNLKINIDVSYRTDLEIPSWKKYVITIDFPPQIKFEERTRIWTILDLTIRNRISELAEKADIEIRKYLKNLNKIFFVHIEL